MSLSETGLLVIQPTPFCNIDCSYCYLPHRTSTKRLSLDLATEIFRKVFAFPTMGDHLTVVWHAGEPLVLPVSYYERMFEMIAALVPPNLRILHSIQTNGTLLSEAWCEFIKKWDVNIGVSLDGPKELHDLYRKQRNGAGSFERTFAGMQALKAANIPFHVISVLTVESMEQPEKMLDFYYDNEIEYVCFNVEEQEGANQSRLVASKNSDLRYSSFLKRFLDLSLQRPRPVLVREVENSLKAIRAHGEPVRNNQIEPFEIISIDCDGNLSTFSPELLGLKSDRYESFHFGNVLQDTFEQIAARVQESPVYADIVAGVRECADKCAYYDLCGGGAPSNKIFENGSAATTETVFCRTFMRSVDTVLDLIERLPGDLNAAKADGDSVRGKPAPSMWPG